MYHVRSTNGNTRLGGAKFDEALIRFTLKRYTEMTGNSLRNTDQLAALRAACEKAKIDLSTVDETTVTICDETISLAITIKRDEYEELIESDIEKTMECVKNAIEDADLDREKVSSLVLVGGGTYTPLVRQKLRTFFGDKIYGTAIGFNSVNPMQAGMNLKSFEQIIQFFN